MVAQRPAAALTRSYTARNMHTRAYFTAYTRGATSVGARKGAERMRPTNSCTSSSPRPQNGGMRAKANLGQLVVCKGPSVVGISRCLGRSLARDTGRISCPDMLSGRSYGRGGATRAWRDWIFTDEIEVLTELIWRVLGRLRAAESRREDRIKLIYSSFSAHNTFSHAHTARGVRGLQPVVSIGPKLLHKCRKGLSVTARKGRPRATMRRPGARRCTRRRASTTPILAATHISSCRRSSVDAVCTQHDDQGPCMATKRRPFGGRLAHGALRGEVVEAGVAARRARGPAASTRPHVVDTGM